MRMVEHREDRRMQMQVQQQFMTVMKMMMMMGRTIPQNSFVPASQANMPPPPTIPPMVTNQTNSDEGNIHTPKEKMPEESK